MIIIKGLKLPKITGIALWPFILLKPKSVSKIIINHEKIHIRQQAELLVIPFYFWYLTEWFFKYIYFRNFEKAYYNISFEREAYQNESNLNYLESRKFWGFLKYF
jgi:hypothetical protein